MSYNCNLCGSNMLITLNLPTVVDGAFVCSLCLDDGCEWQIVYDADIDAVEDTVIDETSQSDTASVEEFCTCIVCDTDLDRPCCHRQIGFCCMCYNNEWNLPESEAHSGVDTIQSIPTTEDAPSQSGSSTHYVSDDTNDGESTDSDWESRQSDQTVKYSIDDDAFLCVLCGTFYSLEDSSFCQQCFDYCCDEQEASEDNGESDKKRHKR
jgi:hypothetical protein